MPFTSIRWKIMLAFLLIVGVSYYLVATSLIGLVGDSLFSDRMRQDHAAADKLAAELGPLYAERDMEKAQQLLESAGGELGGRLMLLDQSGKVQLDTFCELNGSRLELPEVVSVLSMGSASDYGVHRLDDNGGENRLAAMAACLTTPTREWVAYCTSALTADGVVQGVLLYSSPVQEMMDRLSSLQTRMVAYFLIAAAAAMVIALIFSRVLTRPIVSLTKSIQRMGHGDLSVRVPVKGSGELRRLSETFNTMSEKLQMLDTSRNQFVSNASHELKTPLATMKILLENIIYQPEMDAEMRTEFLTDINKEIDRLNSIISDLLTLVSMDSKAMRLNRTTFSLAQVITDTAHRLQPVAGEPSSGIEAGLERPLRNVRRLRQADAGGVQPDGKRHQVYAGGRRHQGAADPLRPGRGDDRHRQRPRHSPGGSGPYLRPLLPGGQGPQPGDRRHGSGPEHRAPDGADARRQRVRGKRRRQGFHFYRGTAHPSGMSQGETFMKGNRKRRGMLAVLLAALCGLLCSCTRAANPLVQAEATPLPGVEQRLHAATAAEDNAASWDVVLYFRYLDYSMLAGESRTLTVRKDESSEAALVRALLAGPSAGEMNLRRALGEDVGLKEVTASGDMLFITLTNSLLRDGIPDGWRSDEFWAEGSPCPPPAGHGQHCGHGDGESALHPGADFDRRGESAAIRLDRSYYLTGEQGPADPLSRDESLLLSPYNTAALLMEAWRSRDFDTIYDFTVAEDLPVPEQFRAEIDAAPSLSDYTLTAGMVNGERAALNVDASLLTDGASTALEAWPLTLEKQGGVWKIPLETLRRLMGL